MTRLKQTFIIALGIVACLIMVVLGLWQKQVYENQGAEANARREAMAPLVLADVAPPSQSVQAGFGRSVTFTGTYLPSQQFLIPSGDGTFRVLTALRQSDGSVVPVVRGTVSSPRAPDPPGGVQHQIGVLAASEGAPRDPVNLPAGQLPSVQLSVLVQQWEQPMIGGYVTLAADEATAQGMAPAQPTLPRHDGRLRNAIYALQWWVFAAFAIAMSLKMARDIGAHRLLDDDEGPGSDESVDDDTDDGSTNQPASVGADVSHSGGGSRDSPVGGLH